MNSWLRKQYGYRKSKRQQNSVASSARFATVSIVLALNSGAEAEDQDRDSDDYNDIEK